MIFRRREKNVNAFRRATRDPILFSLYLLRRESDSVLGKKLPIRPLVESKMHFVVWWGMLKGGSGKHSFDLRGCVYTNGTIIYLSRYLLQGLINRLFYLRGAYPSLELTHMAGNMKEMFQLLRQRCKWVGLLFSFPSENFL
ncbi:hypothetical protein CDAR_422431 [Caerostris darwini]|uniref:Uncharacterized protein n=1 Tax=Caerostris darwini TaxID=1538125 RepID=A0AAV4N345_9ARAC|nr:hypothetical protein CDAR_422431 [Caerostris darwini]